MVLTALTLVATAAACGGGGSGSDDDKAAGPDVTGWTDHDALVAAANKEGTLKVLTSMGPETNAALVKGFEKLYPDIDTTVDEQPNDEGQKTLLELQAGQVDYDLLHLGEDGLQEFYPYLADIDLLQLVKDGVIKMPEEVINPKSPNMMSAGMGLGAMAWNKKIVPESEVPDSYDDFLKPEYKHQFIVNIEATHFAELYKAWGKEKTLDYAKKIGEQDPIWTDSDTAGLTQMAAGEQKFFLLNNYHSAYRIQLEQPDVMGIKFLEPVPAAFTQEQALRKGAEHPAAAVLFLEFLMTPDAQNALDTLEPAQSSVYAEGSQAQKNLADHEVSVVEWDSFEDRPNWAKEIQKVWGFPTGEITSD